MKKTYSFVQDAEVLLPTEVESEEALLSLVLVYREAAWEAVQSYGLTPKSFSREYNGWIFAAMERLFLSGATVDQIALENELGENLLEIPNGPAYLSYLSSLPASLYNSGYYAQKIKEAENWHKLSYLGGELGRIAHNPNGTGLDKARAIAAQILENFTSEKPTHDALRDRWLSRAGNVIYGLGEFRRYHAGLWPVVPELVIKKELLSVIEAAKAEGIKPSQGIVSSVLELARIKAAVETDSIFDAQPDYLVCRNGTLHIPTRTLADHKPEIYATSGVSYNFDPDAKAPAWAHFLGNLARSLSPAVVSFLQEFAGYALTTDTSYELSIWLYGPPGSGKSTFLAGLEAMLGSRAGLLGLADIASNRFALANLPGKTLAISTEQPGDFIASTHILNSIISGESITVDRKFRDAIQVTPRCKLAWAMNELPRVSDPNSGLFRRVKVVEFPAISESQRDPQLKEDIKTEGAGILNWALDGLERLRNRGRFEIPQEVKDATKSFRDNNDIPGRFVEECCVTGADANGESYRAQTGQLYTAYRQWCDQNGHKPHSSTTVAEDWKRLGFEKRRPGGVVHWFNVGLKAN